jgi:hypothetical protein
MEKVALLPSHEVFAKGDCESLLLIGFYRPLDGVTNLKYKLLCFLTPNKKIKRERR